MVRGAARHSRSSAIPVSRIHSRRQVCVRAPARPRSNPEGCVIGLKTDLRGIESGVSQFARAAFIKAHAAGDEVRVKPRRARFGDQLGQIPPQQRFASGKSDLHHAERCGFAEHTPPFGGRKVRHRPDTALDSSNTGNAADSGKSAPQAARMAGKHSCRECDSCSR